MSPVSLEDRLSRRLLTGIAGLVLVFGTTLGVLVSFDLAREFDRALESKARAVVTLYRQQPHVTALNLTMEDGGRPTYLALRLRDGTVREPAEAIQLGPGLLQKKPRFLDVTLPGGKSGRQVEIEFTPAREAILASPADLPEPPLVTLIVAEPLAPLYWKIFYICLGLALFWGLLLLALAMLVHRALQRGLEPVIGLRRQLDRLDVENITHRVNLRDPPREVARMVERVNQLLRLAQSHPRPEPLHNNIARSG
jgi:hypothetical protein